MEKRYSTGVPMGNVTIDDLFWKRFLETVRTQLIPYQWAALNDELEDTEPSHCMRNFRVAAGLEKGEFAGKVFQDSDVAKWLEAVAYTLISHPDPKLEQTADEAIDLIVSAQQSDGYLDTYYIINGLDQRWSNLRDNHELYCAGHMIEAAVAYYQATGKRKLLDAMIRYADYIDSVFGAEDGKRHGYPGHEVIEMALIRLYNVTGNEKYRALAEYFINQRGQTPNYFDTESHEQTRKWRSFWMEYQYNQSHKPVREQTEAVGHAVRAVYLYCGMADVARLDEDSELYGALKTIWHNMTHKRMYVTGSIGSSHFGEAFTYDYDLPNDTMYGETCAAIGLVFLAKRMLEIEPLGEYADVMERALYNGVISGMSLDGRRFFYVNPLEVLPEASEKDENKRHVKPERQKWFSCACCPPNLARLLSSLPGYIYGTDKNDTVYTHLYVGSKSEIQLSDQKLHLEVTTDYPWDENITMVLHPEQKKRFTMALRIPGWCRRYELKRNGKPIDGTLKDGYCYVTSDWQDGDRLELKLAMPVEAVHANPKVRANMGKAALMRGPIVYCLEEADNGKDLHRIRTDKDMTYEVRYDSGMLGGIVKIEGEGMQEQEWEEDTLYCNAAQAQYEKKKLTWIPYYAWANRGRGEMLVWVRE